MYFATISNYALYSVIFLKLCITRENNYCFAEANLECLWYISTIILYVVVVVKVPYRGKIWRALNLVISAKIPYFKFWTVLNLAVQSLNQKML